MGTRDKNQKMGARRENVALLGYPDKAMGRRSQWRSYETNTRVLALLFLCYESELL